MRTALNYLDDNDEKARLRKSKNSGGDDEEEDKKSKPAALPIASKAGKKDEEGDGSGSIKDFRTKMWNLAGADAADDWVPYQWREGEVSKSHIKERSD
jgi:DNA-directed RNA polymerase-3 subunit RPC5